MPFEDLYGHWGSKRLPQADPVCLLGMSPGTFRCAVDRFERSGADVLMDKRFGRESRPRAPVDEAV